MPAVIVLASNLLFEEQDNDTLKNLMTVPVGKPELALAKMALLFLFSNAFMAVGGLVNLAIVLASGLEPTGFWRLFWVGIGQGIMMWAGALPCVLLVVLLNRSYIISVIITFFYTTVNYIFGTNDFLDVYKRQKLGHLSTHMAHPFPYLLQLFIGPAVPVVSMKTSPS